MKIISQTAREGLYTFAGSIALMAAILMVEYLVLIRPGFALVQVPG